MHCQHLDQPHCVYGKLCFSDRVFGLSDDSFIALHNTIRRGDLIGLKGYPGKSKRGQLSIFPNTFTVLAPCLHMLPKDKLDKEQLAKLDRDEEEHEEDKLDKASKERRQNIPKYLSQVTVIEQMSSDS